MNPDHVTGRDEQALSDVQLRVARRADELAKIRTLKANLNVRWCLLAKAEILSAGAGARGFSPQATQRRPCDAP